MSELLTRSLQVAFRRYLLYEILEAVLEEGLNAAETFRRKDREFMETQLEELKTLIDKFKFEEEHRAIY